MRYKNPLAVSQRVSAMNTVLSTLIFRVKNSSSYYAPFDFLRWASGLLLIGLISHCLAGRLRLSGATPEVHRAAGEVRSGLDLREVRGQGEGWQDRVRRLLLLRRRDVVRLAVPRPDQDVPAVLSTPETRGRLVFLRVSKKKSPTLDL